MPRRQIRPHPTHVPGRLHRPTPVGQQMSRWVRLFLVAGILAVTVCGPQAAANAIPNPLDALKSGYECKESPRPQMPREPNEAWFDEQSKSRNNSGNGDPAHPYEVYGWAGLSWHTYDLGCGPDPTRAPDAVADTKFGNGFLSIGKHLMAMAFWLDDQAATPAEAQARGITPMWKNFDNIVTAVATTLKDRVFSPWVGLALLIAACVAGYRALQQNTAAVMKVVMLCGATMLLGGLMIGAPQKAIGIADDTFASLITDTQSTILQVGGGITADDPRNVMIENVLLPDYYKGWFGPNHDPSSPGGKDIDARLRATLAFSYDEQNAAMKPGTNSIDGEKANETANKKAEDFGKLAEELSGQDTGAYRQFQGKESGRTSTGFMAMVKTGMPSLVWAGGSLLKILGLLVIRFAVLFAPIWVPWVAMSGGLLERAFRIIMGAWLWAIAAAGILGIYLVALVRLYSGVTPGIDGAWRLWFLLIMTVIAWSIMRPFKRISTVARSDATSITQKTLRRGRGAGSKLWKGAQWAGGPIQGAAEGLGNAIGDEVGNVKQGFKVMGGYQPSPPSTWRPEGQFDRMRLAQGESNQGYINSVNNPDSVWNKTGRSGPRIDDPVIVDGEVLSSHLGGSGGLSADEHAGGFTNTAVPHRDRIDTHTPAPVRAPDVWDGGVDSPIAPMRLYRPSQDQLQLPAGSSTPSGASSSATPPARLLPTISINRPVREASAPRPHVWDNSSLTDRGRLDG